MKLKSYQTTYTIWFRMLDNTGNSMCTHVECINGSLVNAQRVWDTLALNFHMENTRP